MSGAAGLPCVQRYTSEFQVEKENTANPLNDLSTEDQKHTRQTAVLRLEISCLVSSEGQGLIISL